MLITDDYSLNQILDKNIEIIETSLNKEDDIERLKNFVYVYCNKYLLLKNGYFILNNNSYNLIFLYQSFRDADHIILLRKKYLRENLEQFLTNDYIDHILDILKNGFRDYNLEKVENNERNNNYINQVMNRLNIDIIKKLCNIDPYIFVLKSPDCHCISLLGIIILDIDLFMKNDRLDINRLTLMLLNFLTDIVIKRLFKYVLEEEHISYLMEYYNINNEEELKKKLGNIIANYMIKNTKNEDIFDYIEDIAKKVWR